MIINSSYCLLKLVIVTFQLLQVQELMRKSTKPFLYLLHHFTFISELDGRLSQHIFSIFQSFVNFGLIFAHDSRILNKVLIHLLQLVNKPFVISRKSKLDFTHVVNNSFNIDAHLLEDLLILLKFKCVFLKGLNYSCDVSFKFSFLLFPINVNFSDSFIDFLEDV